MTDIHCNEPPVPFPNRNEYANPNYTTEFLHQVFTEEGKNTFSCRMNVLGKSLSRVTESLGRCSACVNRWVAALPGDSESRIH